VTNSSSPCVRVSEPSLPSRIEAMAFAECVRQLAVASSWRHHHVHKKPEDILEVYRRQVCPDGSGCDIQDDFASCRVWLSAFYDRNAIPKKRYLDLEAFLWTKCAKGFLARLGFAIGDFFIVHDVHRPSRRAATFHAHPDIYVRVPWLWRTTQEPYKGQPLVAECLRFFDDHFQKDLPTLLKSIRKETPEQNEVLNCFDNWPQLTSFVNHLAKSEFKSDQLIHVKNNEYYSALFDTIMGFCDESVTPNSLLRTCHDLIDYFIFHTLLRERSSSHPRNAPEAAFFEPLIDGLPATPKEQELGCVIVDDGEVTLGTLAQLRDDLVGKMPEHIVDDLIVIGVLCVDDSSGAIHASPRYFAFLEWVARVIGNDPDREGLVNTPSDAPYLAMSTRQNIRHIESLLKPIQDVNAYLAVAQQIRDLVNVLLCGETPVLSLHKTRFDAQTHLRYRRYDPIERVLTVLPFAEVPGPDTEFQEMLLFVGIFSKPPDELLPTAVELWRTVFSAIGGHLSSAFMSEQTLRVGTLLGLPLAGAALAHDLVGEPCAILEDLKAISGATCLRGNVRGNVESIERTARDISESLGAVRALRTPIAGEEDLYDYDLCEIFKDAIVDERFAILADILDFQSDKEENFGLALEKPLRRLVVRNLVSNASTAIQAYMGEKGIGNEDVAASLCISREGRFVRARLTNSSPWIDLEMIRHLFDPKYEYPPGKKHLGLFVARQVTRAFGGDIRCSYHRDRCLFTTDLLLRKAQ